LRVSLGQPDKGSDSGARRLPASGSLQKERRVMGSMISSHVFDNIIPLSCRPQVSSPLKKLTCVLNSHFYDALSGNGSLPSRFFTNTCMSPSTSYNHSQEWTCPPHREVLLTSSDSPPCPGIRVFLRSTRVVTLRIAPGDPAFEVLAQSLHRSSL